MTFTAGTAVVTVLGILFFLYSVYFVISGMIGLPKKEKQFPEPGRQMHFAVLIAARNEEKVIGNLLDSIRDTDYPQELRDIYVVVNHCTDRTGEIARAHGAKILNCTAETHTKGDVLKYAFAALANHHEIDAYAVFDADNVVDPGFLREMNKALMSGASVAQCRRCGKNLSDSWVSGCYEIYYMIQNAFFNHARVVSGLSGSISGTGWTVKKDVIDRRGFDPVTMTEDLEFTAQCALNGETITYCSKAVTYDEYPADLRTSMVQRIRWTYGQIQCIRTYETKLIKGALCGSKACMDLTMILLSAIVMVLSVVLSAASCALLPAGVSVPAYLALSAVSSWICCSVTALAAVIKTHDGIRENLKGILLFPLFIVTWIPVTVSCFFRRDCSWTPIEHNRVITIEEKRQG